MLGVPAQSSQSQALQKCVMSSAARRREYPATTTSLLCANDEQGDGQSTPDFVSFGAMLFPLTAATAIISAALHSMLKTS
jgi:hypothetical protein